MNFTQLKKEGKTVIYKNDNPDNSWDFWGYKKTEKGKEPVYRKIVSIEVAKQYKVSDD